MCVTGVEGQTIQVDYLCSAGGRFQIVDFYGNYAPGWGNMVSAESDANAANITFSATQARINEDFSGINPDYSYQVQPQYLGATNNTMPGGGTEYIMTVQAGFTPSAGENVPWSDYDPSWNVVKCTDNEPFLIPSTGPSKEINNVLLGMTVPTLITATVQQVAPKVSAVSWSGPTMVPHFSVNHGRYLTAYNSDIFIKKLFFSN